MSLSLSRLKQVLHYEPETGQFTRVQAGRGVTVGPICGSECDGYRTVVIDGSSYRLHRLAFLYMEGEWPQAKVDHINGDRADNRWANLRHATIRQNSHNRKTRSDSKCGLKGVSWNARPQKWMARIGVDGKSKYLGVYKTPEEAHTAYVVAADRYFGEFARAA